MVTIALRSSDDPHAVGVRESIGVVEHLAARDGK